jgi:hypothetical protein
MGRAVGHQRHGVAMSGRRVLEDRLASASSMILFSVSDSNIDSQIASAATPAAPGTLLMANLLRCGLHDRTASRPRVAGLGETTDYRFERGSRLI